MTTTTNPISHYTLLLLLSLLSASSCFAFVPRGPNQSSAGSSSSSTAHTTTKCRPKECRKSSFLFSGATNDGAENISSIGTDDDDNEANGPLMSAFEEMMRSVTKNEGYKFGDLSKEALSAGTREVENIVHAIPGQEDYHFGDITKGAVKKVSEPVERVLSEAVQVSLIREGSVDELVELSKVFWKERLSSKQRREAIIVGVYFGATAILSYNFVSNLMEGMVVAAAWTRTSVVSGASPLSPGMWPKFMQCRATLNTLFGNPCLPARAIVTVPFFFRFRLLIQWMVVNFPLKKKYTALRRTIAIALTWVVVNLAMVGLFTGGLIWLGSVWSGVPIIAAAH